MKKFFLSSFIIVSFIIYAILEKMSGINKKTSFVSPVSSNNSQLNVPSTQTTAQYKDGEYTGDVADAFYGNVQIKAVINNHKITDVQFLNYPHDRGTSIAINTDAMPVLKTEAINNQNAQVDVVSGATATSQAFIQSLQSALTQAQM